jgi:branched-subunit amino acid ABC-type transport system permease component
MGILNIAPAAFYLLGAYLAWTVVHLTVSFWLALAVAPPLVGAVTRGGVAARATATPRGARRSRSR